MKTKHQKEALKKLTEQGYSYSYMRNLIHRLAEKLLNAEPSISGHIFLSRIAEEVINLTKIDKKDFIYGVLGVSKSAFSHWTGGTIVPTISSIRELSDVFQINVEIFIEMFNLNEKYSMFLEKEKNEITDNIEKTDKKEAPKSFNQSNKHIKQSIIVLPYLMKGISEKLNYYCGLEKEKVKKIKSMSHLAQITDIPLNILLDAFLGDVLLNDDKLKTLADALDMPFAPDVRQLYIKKTVNDILKDKDRLNDLMKQSGFGMSYIEGWRYSYNFCLTGFDALMKFLNKTNKEAVDIYLGNIENLGEINPTFVFPETKSEPIKEEPVVSDDVPTQSSLIEISPVKDETYDNKTDEQTENKSTDDNTVEIKIQGKERKAWKGFDIKENPIPDENNRPSLVMNEGLKKAILEATDYLGRYVKVADINDLSKLSKKEFNLSDDTIALLDIILKDKSLFDAGKIHIAIDKMLHDFLEVYANHNNIPIPDNNT